MDNFFLQKRFFIYHQLTVVDVMEFKNEDCILATATTETYRRLRRDALEILRVSVDAVNPKRVIQNHLNLNGKKLLLDEFELDLDAFSRIFVLGGGKAGGAMAEAIEDIGEGIIDIITSPATGSVIGDQDTTGYLPGEATDWNFIVGLAAVICVIAGILALLKFVFHKF